MLSQREELVFVLNQAAELEHSLCCSYLFTAYSLKSTNEEGLSIEELKTVIRWKREFTNVAIEEMFHLAVVNHLLVTLGAASHFDRPNFPHDCAYYMPEFQIELRPFSKEVLEHFIAVEQPDGSNLSALTAPERYEEIQGALENEIGARPLRLDSQRDIYGIIHDGIQHLAERLGDANTFLAPPASAALRDFFESNGWYPASSLANVEADLHRIIEEGEGSSPDNVNSHHSRFSAILRELEVMKAQNAAFEPSRPVVANPFTRTPPEGSGPVNLIDDEDAVKISDLFNEAYVSMLALLARFFVTDDETDEEAKALNDSAIDVMNGAIGPLGELLTRMPAGPAHPGNTAGPSFVLRTLHPMPYKQAARRLLHERFDELAVYAEGLDVGPAGERPLQRAARSFRKYSERLA